DVLGRWMRLRRSECRGFEVAREEDMCLRDETSSCQQFDPVKLRLAPLPDGGDTCLERLPGDDAEDVDRQTADLESGIKDSALDRMTDQGGDRAACNSIGEPGVAGETRRKKEVPFGREIMRCSAGILDHVSPLARSIGGTTYLT